MMKLLLVGWRMGFCYAAGDEYIPDEIFSIK